MAAPLHQTVHAPRLAGLRMLSSGVAGGRGPNARVAGLGPDARDSLDASTRTSEHNTPGVPPPTRSGSGSSGYGTNSELGSFGASPDTPCSSSYRSPYYLCGGGTRGPFAFTPPSLATRTRARNIHSPLSPQAQPPGTSSTGTAPHSSEAYWSCRGSGGGRQGGAQGGAVASESAKPKPMPLNFWRRPSTPSLHSSPQPASPRVSSTSSNSPVPARPTPHVVSAHAEWTMHGGALQRALAAHPAADSKDSEGDSPPAPPSTPPAPPSTPHGPGAIRRSWRLLASALHSQYYTTLCYCTVLLLHSQYVLRNRALSRPASTPPLRTTDTRSSSHSGSSRASRSSSRASPAPARSLVFTPSGCTEADATSPLVM